MKKILLPLFFITLIGVSCSDSSQTNASIDVPVTRKEMDSEVVKTVANLSIEGMTCSAGCGGKIQKELRALKGVKTTDLDFADARPSNTVMVEYNPQEVSEKEMIQCVNGISDGAYKVKSVEIIQFKGLQGTGGAASSGADVSSNSTISQAYQVFGVVESLLHLIR